LEANLKDELLGVCFLLNGAFVEIRLPKHCFLRWMRSTAIYFLRSCETVCF